MERVDFETLIYRFGQYENLSSGCRILYTLSPAPRLSLWSFHPESSRPLMCAGEGTEKSQGHSVWVDLYFRKNALTHREICRVDRCCLICIFRHQFRYNMYIICTVLCIFKWHRIILLSELTRIYVDMSNDTLPQEALTFALHRPCQHCRWSFWANIWP